MRDLQFDVTASYSDASQRWRRSGQLLHRRSAYPAVWKSRMGKTTPIREDIMISSQRRGRATSQEPVAGNGLINRRAVLGHGIAFAGAMSAAGTMTDAAAEPLKDPQWSLQFGSTLPAVQTASPYEKDVV